MDSEQKVDFKPYEVTTSRVMEQSELDAQWVEVQGRSMGHITTEQVTLENRFTFQESLDRIPLPGFTLEFQCVCLPRTVKSETEVTKFHDDEVPSAPVLQEITGRVYRCEICGKQLRVISDR